MTSASIRTRLLVSVAAIQIAGAALGTALVVEHERHESYSAFDAHLGEQGAVLRSLVEAPEEASGTLVFHREFMALPGSNRFYIQDSAGHKIDGSANWPEIKPLPAGPRSVVNLDVGDTQYRALILQDLPVLDAEAAPTPTSLRITLIYAAPTARVEAHIRRVAFEAIGVCLALLALSTVVLWWALTRGLRPLRDLASAAEKIDVGAWTLLDLEPSRRFIELRPLSDALTELVARLHSAFDRERQFFGDAAHEMKSSVAIVRSTLQLALQTERSASEYRAELNDALDDTGRLQGLVASMLDLARIESSNRAAAHPEGLVAEVHSIAQCVANRLRPLATEKHTLLTIEADHREQWVRMPEDELETVLTNVVENAILHSDPGDRVVLEVRAEGGVCRLNVMDEGCGIATEDLPHLFDRFYRGDASRSRLTGGVGLGLSIARALVTRAHGSISVESQPGVGSVFTIMLPSSGQPEIGSAQDSATLP